MSLSNYSNGGANEKILIAVIGNSPAVLTETVWALAHQKKPWIPDRVVIITTLTGRKVSEKLLLEQKGWERLCAALKKEKLPTMGKLAFGASDSIKVIGDGRRDFEDITTPEENLAAADFILDILMVSTKLGTEVMASIAGGRKTMSALMMACMSLLGREQDRLCHVLADDCFIAQHSGFLFPRNKTEAKAARIQLSEIPYVRVRGWCEQQTGKRTASYSHMVKLFSSSSLPALNYPVVTLDCMDGTVTVDGNTITLSAKAFAILYTMSRRIKSGQLPSGWGDRDLLDELDGLQACAGIPEKCDWMHEFVDVDEKGDFKHNVDANHFNRWASNARSKLSGLLDPRLCEALLPKLKGKTAQLYPANKLLFKNDWISKDV